MFAFAFEEDADDAPPSLSPLHPEPDAFGDAPATVLTPAAASLPETVIMERLSVACGTEACVWRRELSDVRFQRAAEDEMNDAPGPSDANDRVCGVYEGGLKTWECALDLAAHVHSMCTAQGDAALEGARVLELGCGTAIPSLVVLACAPRVRALHVQDYNASVLRWVTLPNLVVNAAARALGRLDPAVDAVDVELDAPVHEAWRQYTERVDVQAFHGSWRGLCNLLHASTHPPALYDLILTSETIYDAASHGTLHDTLCTLLAPGGQVLLAAKSIYFGCSGDVHSFVRLVEARGRLRVERVAATTGTVTRDLLRLGWR